MNGFGKLDASVFIFNNKSVNFVRIKTADYGKKV